MFVQQQNTRSKSTTPSLTVRTSDLNEMHASKTSCFPALIKHQTPHLNTLPVPLPLRLRILYRAVNRPPRRRRLVAVEALDEHHLVGPLPVLVVPPVRRVGPDGPRLLPPARAGVDDGRRDQVRVRDGGCVGQRERGGEDGGDGAPDLAFGSRDVGASQLSWSWDYGRGNGHGERGELTLMICQRRVIIREASPGSGNCSRRRMTAPS